MRPVAVLTAFAWVFLANSPRLFAGECGEEGELSCYYAQAEVLPKGMRPIRASQSSSGYTVVVSPSEAEQVVQFFNDRWDNQYQVPSARPDQAGKKISEAEMSILDLGKDENKRLSTSGLIICSAVAVSYRGKLFLAHVDGGGNQTQMLLDGLGAFFGQKTIPPDAKIFVKSGAMGIQQSVLSLYRVKTAMEAMHGADHIAYLGGVGSTGDEVVITEEGLSIVPARRYPG